MGVGASMKLDATIAGKAMMMNAGVLRAGAHASTDAASRVSRKANLIRQLQDRRFQANQAGRDIKCIDQQILAQKTRIQIAEAEIKSQEQQAKNMQEVEEYLRTKYTSQQLYAWMEVSVRQLFYQSYLAAMDMAKAAERAFAFEYSSGKAPQFLSSNGYWDASRSGLMAGQQLALSLRRMEAYHIKTPTHDYELTKVISLRQIAPMALLSLRRKGFAEFQLQEVLFDQDFPGHYCRRIKTVSVLIPGIVGPYTGISSTLRLLEHRYRLKPGSDSSSGYYETDTSGDDRFRTDRIPITAIALSSSGQQDTGVFELNFRDERYLPFEGAGVISRWRLELPAPYPQFDYDTISDVVLTLRFTSLEGGAAWKKQASEAVVNHHKTLLAAQGTEGDDNGNFFVIDLLNDVRQEWTLFSQAVKSLPAPARDETDFKFRIRNVNDFLPFWARGQEVNLRNVWLNLNVEKDGWKTTKLPTVFGVSMKLTSDSRPDSLVQLVPNLENTMQVVEDGDIIFPATCLNGKVPRRMWLVGQYTVQPKSGLR
ncbi:uncharacterized protein N7483_002010 [Penicillium malachiteum]|uniref:uncharacterized protein n=1 Tax=Penicillium malachiteum TaxID=1324776 RepID=UPI002548898B|nr:uncharacterized protein N7483_002010 [Penicillium malachiteum]KAJ5736885.1 hypothetical protein N7483_002010 [Penicillium malachiteum]